MAPMAIVRAALRRMERGAAVAVLSAILADVPTAGMAAYTASKCALSAMAHGVAAGAAQARRDGVRRAAAAHRDRARRAGRSAATAPPMKAGSSVDELVGLVVDGIRTGRRELRYDLRAAEFTGR